MTDRELMQQALAFIITTNKNSQFWLVPESNLNKTVTAIRERLAQPEQEPVACIGTNGELMWLHKPQSIYSKARPLYTSPPQRKPLTEDQLVEAYCCVNDKEWAIGGMTDARIFARAIERAHNIGEKE